MMGLTPYATIPRVTDVRKERKNRYLSTGITDNGLILISYKVLELVILEKKYLLCIIN